jgi:hypothetical protein
MGKALRAFRLLASTLALAVSLIPAAAFGMDYGEVVARVVLLCYHPTGKYVGYDMHGDIASAIRYRSLFSENLNIDFRGRFTDNPYSMGVALLLRWYEGTPQVRTEVLRDSAIVPPNPDCTLGNWTDVRL